MRAAGLPSDSERKAVVAMQSTFISGQEKFNFFLQGSKSNWCKQKMDASELKIKTSQRNLLEVGGKFKLYISNKDITLVGVDH